MLLKKNMQFSTDLEKLKSKIKVKTNQINFRVNPFTDQEMVDSGHF